MSLLTTWGYKLTEIDTIPEMLNFCEFNLFTGGRYAGEEDRITAEIKAADAAIRNYVGWHLAPAAVCELRTTFMDRRVTRVGSDILIQLPARYVTEINAVTIGGVEFADYVLETTGLLYLLNAPCHAKNALIVVEYQAGLPESLLAPIQELIAHRVTHSVAVPSGITSEASGGVSVTYNANWINNSRATALAGDNKELLIPYKVQGVF